MNHIALFGITGRTGKPLAELLLKKGFTIKALARRPDKLTMKHENLTILQGNIQNPDDVRHTIEGTDAVISVIGHVPGDKQASDIQTIGTRNILNAMKSLGVKRLISLTGGAVPYKEDKPKFADKAISTIMNLVAKDVVTDGIAHADLIQQSSTDWTIARGPRLLEEPPKGAYRVGWVGVNTSSSISYGDLAQFIVDELETGKHIHTMPFVSY
jgi:putative NADH-flavin reductase